MFDHVAKDHPQACLDFKERLMEVAKGNPLKLPGSWANLDDSMRYVSLISIPYVDPIKPI